MLTFDEVLDQSIARAKRWHPGGLADWSALEWAGAMAGEAGEACNAAKKLRRIEQQIQNLNEGDRSLTDTTDACIKIAEEVADTILYGMLLAARVGVDIEPVLIRVFNRKSEEYGFPERLGGETADV
jgi:NTP pyrophosphatase (non-canonical NTP hydrolase)